VTGDTGAATVHASRTSAWQAGARPSPGAASDLDRSGRIRRRVPRRAAATKPPTPARGAPCRLNSPACLAPLTWPPPAGHMRGAPASRARLRAGLLAEQPRARGVGTEWKSSSSVIVTIWLRAVMDWTSGTPLCTQSRTVLVFYSRRGAVRACQQADAIGRP
jgi:hypothetical protein